MGRNSKCFWSLFLRHKHVKNSLPIQNKIDEAVCLSSSCDEHKFEGWKAVWLNCSCYYYYAQTLRELAIQTYWPWPARWNQLAVFDWKQAKALQPSEAREQHWGTAVATAGAKVREVLTDGSSFANPTVNRRWEAATWLARDFPHKTRPGHES